MNPCLAILAHEGAALPIRDFQPGWERLGFPIIAFLPEGETWPGEPVTNVLTHGRSSHGGRALFDRFLHCAQALLRSTYDLFIIAEYDTAFFLDELPAIDLGAINCAPLIARGGDSPPEQVLAFSPWIVTRPLLAALIEALRMQLRQPTREAWVGGLLDRWLGTAIQQSGLRMIGLPGVIAWADYDLTRPGAKPPLTIVHGWKSRAQFQDLWPQQ